MGTTAAAIEEIYRTRYPAFRRAVATLVGGYDMAHDAVQEGFARALVRRERYRGEGSLEGWIWTIVLRTAQEMRRTAPGEEPLSFDPELPAAASFPELADALRQLSPRRRLVVFLRYYADLSYAGISEVAGVSEGTVAATLSQARAELWHALRPEESDVGR